MKKSLFILFLSILVSCNPIKYSFAPATQDSYDRLSSMLESHAIISNNELFLALESFKNDSVTVKENNDIIFDSVISTAVSKPPKVLKIKNNSLIAIKFKNVSHLIIIKKEQMKLYKYIYLERKRNKIEVEFNNQKTFKRYFAPNI